jgi:hypothetical protein
MVSLNISMEKRFDAVKLTAYSMVKAYTSAYAFCYLAAALIGLHDPKIGIGLSRLLMLSVGIGLLMSIYTEKKSFIYFMAAVEAMGCFAHFFEVVQWVPALNTNGYLLMSMLDLSQCIFLFLIIEYKNKAKTFKMEDISITNM